MRKRTLVSDVARWEFWRFFKLKDFTISFILALGILLAIRFVDSLRQGAANERLTIAVAPAEYSPLPLGTVGRFELIAPADDEGALRESLAGNEFDGLLLFRTRDDAELAVRGRAAWQAELQGLLASARRDERLAESSMSASELQRLLSPLQLSITIEGAEGRGGAARTMAFVLIGFMLVGVMVGNSYLFVGITGEKNQRVTELILTAVSPQTWIDGKILGLSVLVVFNLLVYGAAYVVSKYLGALIWSSGVDFPRLFADPFLFFQVLILAVLGFGFWFTFYALIASTISDPNTSARGMLIMLPVLPLGVALAGVGQPDALWIKVLGLFPLTSPTVLPARLLLGSVGWWEVPLAVLLLIGAVWLLRRAAGKVFGITMLLYGREPTWSEVARWAKAAA